MGTGKKKIEIKKKEKAEDRMVTFSKRKKGLFQKASQLNTLSGSQIAILVFSPAGRPHTNIPFFDPALSRYLSSVGAGGDATTITADDVGPSGQSKDDSFDGMFLNSVEDFLLGVGEGGEIADHDAYGSRKQSVNDCPVGMWVNPVHSLFVGKGGESTSDFPARESNSCIREWLNSIEVERIDTVEELLLMKQTLEKIREKVAKKVDDTICCSYFV